MFLTHTELLPEDETIEEHRAGKEAETKVVAADRAGPGLFKGLFHRDRFPLRGLRGIIPAAAIVDAEDGVERCPVCAWELEDGECGHCGWNEDVDDESFNSDEDDRDISPVDDFGGPVDMPTPQQHNYIWGDEPGDINEGYDIGPMSPAPYSIADGDSEEDSEDEDDAESMSSFISNDEDDDLPDEVDRDDESVQTVQGYGENSPARQYSTDGGNTDEMPRLERSPPRRFYAIDTSEVSDDSDGSGDDQTTTTTTTQTSDDDSEEQHTSYDSDSSSVREVSPPVIPQISRTNGVKRRRIVDDSDDEDEESDDTAIRPRQTTNSRFQYLRGQRPRMPERRRITISPDEEPPRQHSRRGGTSFAARRGRPMATRVY